MRKLRAAEMISVQKTHRAPVVFTVVGEGVLSYEEAAAAAVDFAALLEGAPRRRFRVVVDLSRARTMPPHVAEVFMATQNLAVGAGLERDAFVVESAVLRLQLERLASSNARKEALGPLKVFETLPAAMAYVLD